MGARNSTQGHQEPNPRVPGAQPGGTGSSTRECWKLNLVASGAQPRDAGSSAQHCREINLGSLGAQQGCQELNPWLPGA